MQWQVLYSLKIINKNLWILSAVSLLSALRANWLKLMNSNHTTRKLQNLNKVLGILTYNWFDTSSSKLCKNCYILADKVQGTRLNTTILRHVFISVASVFLYLSLPVVMGDILFSLRNFLSLAIFLKVEPNCCTCPSTIFQSCWAMKSNGEGEEEWDRWNICPNH